MRSQPPFLTDLILQVYAQLDPSPENKEWLRRAMLGAIKEYHTVWMSAPRLDLKTGLSRFRPDGLGIPPETEASHFTSVLTPFADALGISVNEFAELYNSGEVSEPILDTYFLHDRAVRESGHDTSYRLEKRCGNLGTVDLASLLYKYEVDIGNTIRDHFDDSLELDTSFAQSVFPFGEELPFKSTTAAPTERSTQNSAEWFARAERRKELCDHYLWHEGRSLYTDLDTATGKQSLYDSVSSLSSKCSTETDARI